MKRIYVQPTPTYDDFKSVLVTMQFNQNEGKSQANFSEELTLEQAKQLIEDFQSAIEIVEKHG